MRIFAWLCLAGIVVLVAASSFAQDLDVTDAVAAHEAFVEDPSKPNRSNLLGALEAYQGDATVETVNAYLALLKGDTSSGKYRDMRESALATSLHLEPVAEILPKQYMEAKYIAALAYFNTRQNSDAILEMAHVEGFTKAFVDEIGEKPEWAEDLRWKSDAWGMAMEAYFKSAKERHPSSEEVDEILASYGADEASLNDQAMQSLNESGLPQCSGTMIQRPKLRYPAGKAMRGMFGAVILGLEFDTEGNVINPRVLASIPIEEFDEKSLRVVGKWRYKPDDPEQVGVSCRLERTDVVQPLIFQMR